MLPTFRRKKLDFCRSHNSREKWRAAKRGRTRRRPASLSPGRDFMRKTLWIVVASAVVLVALAVIIPCIARGGDVASAGGFQVLAPIHHGNLTIFPVVSGSLHDTREFLTLDEGLHSG